MESNFDQDDIENIQINSLTDLDCFVAERFNLPCVHTQQISGQLWNWLRGI